ncbi:MAG: hypothetical protein LC772_04655, partial [Chloroflexi bacterium]|nr:hypothetical protein [Chloroflexota bacterium]
AANPERFVRHTPQPPELPTAAWINPPPAKTDQDALLRHARAAENLKEARQALVVTSDTSVLMPTEAPSNPITQEVALFPN